MFHSWFWLLNTDKKYYSVLEGYAGMTVAAYNHLKSGV